MIDEVLNSYRLILDYLRRLVADVPDGDLARQLNGVANHPAWVIGHLTCSCQGLGGELGLAAWLPKQWESLFNTGSVPTSDRSAYPPKAELLAALADGQVRLSERLAALGDAAMSGPLPDERYRALFPTLGHAVLHILTGHAAVHVGQVSVWRRAAGHQPLSETFP
ncbi:MAG TPA: DinB family protein [Phycisphaerae bacterium]|nr:DinB family protein [Phycisphaerae bacterium]